MLMFVDDRDDKTDNSCLLMLSIFSSKRHGEPDTKLPRSVRLAIMVSCCYYYLQ